jgi:hypothetical protein
MILVPVLLHAAFAIGVICVHTYARKDISLPSTIVRPGLALALALALAPVLPAGLTDLYPDSLLIHRCRSHARLPQSNLLESLLGRS